MIHTSPEESSEAFLKLLHRSLLSVLMAFCITGCSLSDGGRTLVLIPNPIGAVASQIERHRIKGPNDSWTLFTDLRRERENALISGFYRLCNELSINESQLIQISGFRILKKNSLASLPARGYPTAIDFYSSFSSRRAQASTVVEAIETAIASERLSVVLEFQEEGVWKRSSFDPNVGRIVRSDAVDLVASHGMVFTQIPTQHEDRYSIYAVEIGVIELATGKVVARNVGLVQDTYLGAHNRFALLPDSRRCGYPIEENFVGSWLLSLTRPHPAGATDPYDGFSKRPPVTDEDRHWSSRSRRR